MKKITQAEYLEFLESYDPFKPNSFFGKEFCDTFDIKDPELMATWDDEKAGDLIQKYIED